ncbi:hypothetical protein Bpfe_030023 [Biomphalaria pfeifferi]|uniref:Uncharacterized protein n=1 Tax=Biomphalaria pfeifferi TaxID=112525 RepID=A0AAD8EV40_BIOPF|nr:hypothetical protein Bpfe_030023 [Biomphalaria pfeifferi]
MSKRGRTSYLQDKSETLALMGKRRRRYADKLKSDPASQNRSSITPTTYLSVSPNVPADHRTGRKCKVGHKSRVHFAPFRQTDCLAPSLTESDL